FSAEGRAGGLVAIFAPLDTFLLSQLNPILSRLARLRPRHGEPVSTGLYEKRDILEFLRRQNEQAGNRVPEADLLIAFHALQFGDKQVARVMTPRRQVKMVKADETAGPILTDELHKTGFSRFPVVKDSVKATHPQIIGTLYLNDLIGYEGNGKVKDLADRKVYFINEDSNLHQALSAFLKTHHHLLIVVNSFEEMVGVLSLEDVLEQIIGKQLRDEFDNYENSRAVASAETEHHSKSEEHPSADAAEAKNPIASSQK
ncbi:MAG TPA: CBS domain-containing protein, partial [Candidatus Saccharimonadales bacterium]|nr:CBS domain-containing protein [Candidatus Saccharimonadales bacterium]